MKNLNEIKKQLELHKQRIKDKYHIKSIGIFGSVARGDATLNSDVDILVEFEKPIGLDFVSLGDELEEILSVKVDLVTPNAIKPKMFKYIKQDVVYV
ncbi:MAG: nucleotidyltransferase [Ignavibacteria bacterium RBG_16_34_14]|nr:MAG: nucleotidyltransferase [Ignavibacteria bacterium RBG_16_34_14]